MHGSLSSLQDDGTAEFASVLNSKISELEKGMGGSSMEREAAKLRRKQLREVQRYCTDKQNSAEDRITYVQGKYTALVSFLDAQPAVLPESSVRTMNARAQHPGQL